MLLLLLWVRDFSPVTQFQQDASLFGLLKLVLAELLSILWGFAIAPGPNTATHILCLTVIGACKVLKEILD